MKGMTMDDKEHPWDDWDLPKGLTIIPWLIWAVIAVGIILAVALATNAHAAPVFKNVGNDGNPLSLMLLYEPCTNEKVLGHLRAGVKEEYIPKFQAAVLHYGKKDWASCWIEIQGHVLSIDEEGFPLHPPDGIPRKLFLESSV